MLEHAYLGEWTRACGVCLGHGAEGKSSCYHVMGKAVVGDVVLVRVPGRLSHVKPQQLQEGPAGGRAACRPADLYDMRHQRGRPILCIRVVCRFRRGLQMCGIVCVRGVWGMQACLPGRAR